MSRIPKSVLVTGAAGALGSHVARKFAEAGCEVFAVGHHAGDAPKPVGGDGFRWLSLDLADPEAVRREIGGIADRIDALAHCAGGFRWAKSDSISDADIEFLLDSNLKSSLYLARALLPAMQKRGFGRIVFVGSRATLATPSGMGAYAASKAGLNALTSAIADEVRAFDINVNAVLPTMIDTPANRRDMPNADFSAWVDPEELAGIIFALTQPLMKPVHGALLPVAGRL